MVISGRGHRRLGRGPCRPRGNTRGLTLIEVMLVLAILSTLAGIAIPLSIAQIEKTRRTRAIAEIRGLERRIDGHAALVGQYPESLAEIAERDPTDPWGNPYRYLNIETAGKGKGEFRKDRNLVPLNSTYDLYSMGKDGDSRSPLTAKASHDDILRANDGAFVGLASDY